MNFKLFPPWDGGLGEIVAIKLAERKSNISLSKAQFDALLFENFGELFQLFQIRRLFLMRGKKGEQKFTLEHQEFKTQ